MAGTACLPARTGRVPIVFARQQPLITSSDITAALRGLGIERTDTLLVHSDVRAALRVEGSTVAHKVETIIEALEETVAGGTLMMPTFTYSFCRGDDFDLDASPSTVGALTEAFRLRKGVWRTAEPLFSTAVRGPLPAEWERDLRAIGDKECFGELCVFALLRERAAKILFFGTGFETCTFVHYLEQREGVPYRYMKDFTGIVVAGGRRRRVTASYYVRRPHQDVDNHLAPLCSALLADGAAQAADLADGPSLLVTDTQSVERVVHRELSANPDFLLARGHGLASGAAA